MVTIFNCYKSPSLIQCVQCRYVYNVGLWWRYIGGGGVGGGRDHRPSRGGGYYSYYKNAIIIHSGKDEL